MWHLAAKADGASENAGDIPEGLCSARALSALLGVVNMKADQASLES